MKIPEWVEYSKQECRLGKNIWSVPRLAELSQKLNTFDAPLDCLCVYRKYDITLREMLMHIKAVMSADTSFPIILDEDGELMDGAHRIMAAILRGEATIKAVRFEENPSPCRREE